MSLTSSLPLPNLELVIKSRSCSNRLLIIGTGFVADFYMMSLASFPDLKVVKAYDVDADRLSRFCLHWKIAPADSLEELLREDAQLVLNLTNPASHFAVTKACLDAGLHVYSEKPLATSMADAYTLYSLASSRGLGLSSAPCSFLGEAAQTAIAAIRSDKIGPVRLVYAELDDGFLVRAPYREWRSVSGAPWPYSDEFRVGCTVEHAGYYLTWLIAMFGAVETVISASAETVPNKLEVGESLAPDFACATLFFRSGVVARLTCSIVAPHNHSLRIIGDEGTLELRQSWDNHATVRLRRRYAIRRRLVELPFASRVRLVGPSHSRAPRWGATAMNFALGPVELLNSLEEGRPCRLSSEFALHLNEVTLAIQEGGGCHRMETRCSTPNPMQWAVLR